MREECIPVALTAQVGTGKLKELPGFERRFIELHFYQAFHWNYIAVRLNVNNNIDAVKITLQGAQVAVGKLL